jgi:hypothetical protein
VHLFATSCIVRPNRDLHRPIANLSCFQKGASYSGIRIFNNLPQSITSLRNEKSQFKAALNFFYVHTPFTLWMNFFACTDDMYCWLTWLCQFLHCNKFICLVCFCMFLTCSTSYCLVTVSGINAMYICTYECMYVCTYVWIRKDARIFQIWDKHSVLHFVVRAFYNLLILIDILYK